MRGWLLLRRGLQDAGQAGSRAVSGMHEQAPVWRDHATLLPGCTVDNSTRQRHSPQQARHVVGSTSLSSVSKVPLCGQARTSAGHWCGFTPALRGSGTLLPQTSRFEVILLSVAVGVLRASVCASADGGKSEIFHQITIY